MHARMRPRVVARRLLRPACACLILLLAAGAAEWRLAHAADVAGGPAGKSGGEGAAHAWDQGVWRPVLRQHLSTALQPEFPNAARLIQDPQADVAEPLRDVVLALLKSAEAAPPGRHAMLLLAADQLAARLERQFDPTQHPEALKDWDPAIPGLSYELHDRDPSYAYSTYGHDLLLRIWEERPHSEWREFAFLELEDAGWSFSESCTRSHAPFVEVIDRGAAYLDEHPGSAYRAALLLFLAQAHETRWTVSRMPNAPAALDGVAPHAEAARQAAVVYYGKVIAEFPQSAEAAYARERLESVQSGAPPNQWKYFCLGRS